MINLGRFGIFNLGPALLAGFFFSACGRFRRCIGAGSFGSRWNHDGRGDCMALSSRTRRKRPVFRRPNPQEETGGAARSPLQDSLSTIASNPVVWVIACAYACTGAVRQGIDQWFPRFMRRPTTSISQSAQFQLSDFSFHLSPRPGRLFPVTSPTRFSKVAGLRSRPVSILSRPPSFCWRHNSDSVNAAVIYSVLISFTANATHSILGTAAPMDIGGAKMAGFATGVIDSFQYFGGSFAGYFLGALLDKGWDGYFYFMAPFGVAGGMLMLSILGRVTLAKPSSSSRARGATSCP